MTAIAATRRRGTKTASARSTQDSGGLTVTHSGSSPLLLLRAGLSA